MGEEIIALIVLIFATSIGGLILWKLFDITRNSISKNKPSYDENRFDKLAKAFIQQRNKTDQRLENIEAMLTEGKKASSHFNQQQDTQTIEALDFKRTKRQDSQKNENNQRTT